MSSLPSSYQPALQTITADSKTNRTIMFTAELTAFFTEEAQHQVIKEDQIKQAESSLYLGAGSKDKKGKGCGAGKGKKLDVRCGNSDCKKLGYTEQCWVKGGGKEGQGPHQKDSKKGKQRLRVQWSLQLPKICSQHQDPCAKEWQAVYGYNVSQLQKLRTWKIVSLPAGVKVIPYSTIHREKLDPESNVDSWQVRVLAGGNKQTYRVDYIETFAATVKLLTVCMVLRNAAQQDWEIHQVDVKNAYLNVHLEEDIYMTPPPGVLKLRQEGIVC